MRSGRFGPDPPSPPGVGPRDGARFGLGLGLGFGLGFGLGLDFRLGAGVGLALGFGLGLALGFGLGLALGPPGDADGLRGRLGRLLGSTLHAPADSATAVTNAAMPSRPD
jgi:hypothetical protein